MGRWKYKLEDKGKQLGKLINEGDSTLETVIAVYNQMIDCLKFLKLKLDRRDKIDLSYEIDSMIYDFQTKCQDGYTDEYDYYEEKDDLNFNLRLFYDFCDDNKVWIGL